MDNYTIIIKDSCNSQNTILRACNDLVIQFKKNRYTRLILDFNGCDFLYPDYALPLLCTVKYINNSIAEVKGKI